MQAHDRIMNPPVIKLREANARDRPRTLNGLNLSFNNNSSCYWSMVRVVLVPRLCAAACLLIVFMPGLAGSADQFDSPPVLVDQDLGTVLDRGPDDPNEGHGLMASTELEDLMATLQEWLEPDAEVSIDPQRIHKAIDLIREVLRKVDPEDLPDAGHIVKIRHALIDEYGNPCEVTGRYDSCTTFRAPCDGGSSTTLDKEPCLDQDPCLKCVDPCEEVPQACDDIPDPDPDGLVGDLPDTDPDNMIKDDPAGEPDLYGDHYQDGVEFTYPYEEDWSPTPMERSSFLLFPETPYARLLYDMEAQLSDLLGYPVDDLRDPPPVEERPYDPIDLPDPMSPVSTFANTGGQQCRISRDGGQEACTAFLVHGIKAPRQSEKEDDPWYGPVRNDLSHFDELQTLLLEDGGYANAWRVDYYGGACDHDIRGSNYGHHDRGYASGHNAPGKPTYGCNGVHHLDHSIDTDIRHLAYHLAKTVELEKTQFNDYVDIAAHSMGGLVTRSMLAQFNLENRDDFFPDQLMVEDVVTMGTPHDGYRWEDMWWDCPGQFLQVEQMCSQSNFANELRSIGQDPQGTGGTEWTLIGSECDWVVRPGQATRMDAYIRWKFQDDGWCNSDVEYGHNDYHRGLKVDQSGADLVYSQGPHDDAYWYRWTDGPQAGYLIYQGLTRFFW